MCSRVCTLTSEDEILPTPVDSANLVAEPEADAANFDGDVPPISKAAVQIRRPG
jgi:hypothetical protein